MKQIVSLMIALGLSCAAWGQQSLYKRIEIGVGLGASLYSGDIHQYPRAANVNLGGEAFFRYNFTTYFAGRAYLEHGGFKGSFDKSADETMQDYPYGFKTRYYGAAAVLEYNFFNFRGTRELYRASPYVFAGIGLSNYNVRQFRDGSESGAVLPGIKPMIPFGFGIKYGLSYRINLGLEFRTNKPLTDGLDGLDSDVAGTYPAWNPKNDLYYFIGFSAAYRFISIRCPETSSDYMF